MTAVPCYQHEMNPKGICLMLNARNLTGLQQCGYQGYILVTLLKL